MSYKTTAFVNSREGGIRMPKVPQTGQKCKRNSHDRFLNSAACRGVFREENILFCDFPSVVALPVSKRDFDFKNGCFRQKKKDAQAHPCVDFCCQMLYNMCGRKPRRNTKMVAVAPLLRKGASFFSPFHTRRGGDIYVSDLGAALAARWLHRRPSASHTYFHKQKEITASASNSKAVIS